MSDQTYSYTRTCPECEGAGEEWMRWGDDYHRSGVVCSYCGGEGVVDVYVEHEHEVPAVLLAPGEDGSA